MIIRCLTQEEINNLYKDREIKKDESGITSGQDYIVMSVGLVPELKPNTDTSIRYWILTNDLFLNPYDAYNFKIIDSHFPSNWIMNITESAMQLCDPKWAQPGYVEDYFDDEKITDEYGEIMRKIFRESVEAAKQKGIDLNLAVKSF